MSRDEDLAAVQRTLGLINTAVMPGRDAPVVAAVINYLNHLQTLLIKELEEEKANGKEADNK